MPVLAVHAGPVVVLDGELGAAVQAAQAHDAALLHLDGPPAPHLEALSGHFLDMKHWERIAGLADEGKEGQDMPNNIAAIKKYTTILDRVYQREATSSCLNSLARMARAGRNAKEIMIPKVSMTGFGTSSELIESRATQHVRRPSSPICCCMRFSISLNTCLRTAELPQTSST